MRITRIDIEGIDGRYATISRKSNSCWIEIEILMPELESQTRVLADCSTEQWAAAVDLQKLMDGHEGTNSMIHDYYNEIRRFAD